VLQSVAVLKNIPSALASVIEVISLPALVLGWLVFGVDVFVCMCYSVLQSVAKCRSVMQCDAVCCSVLQCVAVLTNIFSASRALVLS